MSEVFGNLPPGWDAWMSLLVTFFRWWMTSIVTAKIWSSCVLYNQKYFVVRSISLFFYDTWWHRRMSLKAFCPHVFLSQLREYLCRVTERVRQPDADRCSSANSLMVTTTIEVQNIRYFVGVLKFLPFACLNWTISQNHVSLDKYIPSP